MEGTVEWFHGVSRGLLVVISALVLLGNTSAGDSLTPDDSLVSWWPAEGDADDVSGGNHGKLLNGVAFASGRIGQAFSFDGNNDGISILKTASLNMGPNDFSIEAWVKLDRAQTHQGAIFFNYAGVPYYALFVTADAKARVLFRPGYALTGNDNDPFVAAAGTTSLRDGQWHHLVGVRSSATALIYVDGVLEGSATNPSVLTVNGGSVDTSRCAYARIGAVHTSTGHCTTLAPNVYESQYFFQGLIDEVKVYDRALSECEIQALADVASYRTESEY